MRRATAALALVVAAAGCQFSLTSVLDGSAAVDDLGVAGPDFANAVPRGLGSACSGTGQCESGNCVDGYCCESLCDPADPANLCKACNVPGSEGHCVAAAAGTDPHQQCEPDPVASCGKDGLCDGNGACRRYPAGTTCGAASCAGGAVTAAPVCDGSGTCVTGAATSCAPYTCANATACATSCTAPDVGCAPPAVCTAGSCGKRAPGQPCSQPSDCLSGMCAPQGVCCDAACTGRCEACNLGGQPPGHCAPLPMGTSCAPAVCMDDAALSARSCDGSGSDCPPAKTATDCTPYTCNSANAMCFGKPCAGDQQCAAGHRCFNGIGGDNKCH